MSEPQPETITASCYECGSETQWKPDQQRQYWGFRCTTCSTFQQGGMFDAGGVWWENREGALRRKE